MSATMLKNVCVYASALMENYATDFPSISVGKLQMCSVLLAAPPIATAPRETPRETTISNVV